MFVFSEYIALIAKLIVYYIYRWVDGYTHHWLKPLPISTGSTTRGYYISGYPGVNLNTPVLVLWVQGTDD